ncbi:hypothetical protein, conserved [Babesia ovata]|uniref:C3H1-type domain-containing protein n=1 Tax=Babesia ovata TaxID=189622 RepID=A0A2H6KAG0_9APIC|nr:uncharacterized protein BOVATA_014770 [Babesia ovata]GBE59984.1 hypothetical protein, conserved [Babesia ovata]
MSFLHGVLESVKGDENVTKYSVSSELDGILQYLQNSVGKGAALLAGQLKEVCAWLNRYEMHLGRKTGDVITQLGELKDKKIDEEYRKRVSISDTKPLHEQLSDWTNVLKEVETEVKKLEGDYVSKFDSSLKQKIMSEINDITEAVWLLQDSAKEKAYVEQVKAVDRTLDEEEKKLKRQMKLKCEEHRGMVAGTLNGIGVKLKELAGFNTAHFGGIKKNLEDTKEELVKLNCERKGDIRFYIDAIKQKVDESYVILCAKKKELDDLVSSAQQSFVAIQQNVGKQGGVPPNSIYSDWDNLKTKMQNFVKELNGASASDPGGQKAGILREMVSKFGTYAEKFKKEGPGENTFSDIVEEWIDDILRENGVVNAWLDAYFKKRNNFKEPFNGWNSKREENSTRTKKLAGLIAKQLSQQINEAVQGAQSLLTSTTNISDHVRTVHLVSKGFANKIGEKIKTEIQINQFASELVKTLHMSGNDGLLMSAPSSGNTDTDLFRAVRYTICELVGAARQAGWQIGSCTGDDNSGTDIGNVNEAMDKVAEINKQFNDNKDEDVRPHDYGHNIQTALDRVVSKIESLGTFLGKTLDRGGSIQEKIDSDTNGLQSVIEELYKLIKESEDKEHDGIINKNIKEVDLKMDKLRDKVRDKLIELADVVSQADETISHAIDGVKHAISDAAEKTNQAVSHLKSQLLADVEAAFARVTYEVKQLFADQKLADLKALGTLVSRQLKTVKGIIDKDLKSGLKGFLKILSGVQADVSIISVPGNKLTELMNAVHSLPEGSTHSEKLTSLLQKFQNYSGHIYDYVTKDMMQNFASTPKVNGEYAGKLQSIHSHLSTLLSHLREQKHFTHAVPRMLQTLKTSVLSLHSTAFANPAYPVLDAFPKSLVPFVEQLEKGYVNKYEGGEEITWQEHFSNNPTEESGNVSKICLSVFSILNSDLSELKRKCEVTSKSDTINERTEIGRLLMDCGFIVSTTDERQDGELRNKTDCHCGFIDSKLAGEFVSLTHKFRLTETISELFTHLKTYYQVSHHATLSATKHPSNVYQMLTWCAGFRYNHMFSKVDAYVKTLFQKPDDQKNDDYSKIDPMKLRLVATATIQPTNVVELVRSCTRRYDAISWRDCWYGRGVGGSAWNCNEKQCPNQECKLSGDQNAKQSATQNANQTADQICNQHPKCGIKSPLQSFLEDGLPGFLPHQLTKLGCGMECSLGKHRGLPCKTPMGFGDISVAASHTKNGEYLKGILEKLCGKARSPLSILCSFLTCLLQRHPQTLGDMFAFYFNFLNGWANSGTHRKDAFDKAVNKAYFGEAYPQLNVFSIFQNTAPSSNTHTNGALLCLVNCDNAAPSKATCGRYLQPMGFNTWLVFTDKNADKYLSWIVYLTETFYDLLKKLYDDCCIKCNKPGTRCYDKSCVKTCVASHSSVHSNACKSIANCPYSRPTLAKYGFTLQSPYNLSGANDAKNKRTCKDLCNALKHLLDEKNVLFTLAYKTIPQFLFEIRAKFIWTLVALWSLSLLYLLHITVVRLDVLRIRSHLRSPASHRIAAQSLLAAARVRALANVKYFSP